MSEPLISIIDPVYNIAPYLTRCIDSLLAQTYTNLEIITVDDGSTDGSGNILDDYSKRDSRLSYFILSWLCRQLFRLLYSKYSDKRWG